MKGLTWLRNKQPACTVDLRALKDYAGQPLVLGPPEGKHHRRLVSEEVLASPLVRQYLERGVLAIGLEDGTLGPRPNSPAPNNSKSQPRKPSISAVAPVPVTPSVVTVAEIPVEVDMVSTQPVPDGYSTDELSDAAPEPAPAPEALLEELPELALEVVQIEAPKRGRRKKS